MVGCRTQTSSHTGSFRLEGWVSGGGEVLGGFAQKQVRGKQRLPWLGFLIIHSSNEVSAGIWLVPGVLF